LRVLAVLAIATGCSLLIGALMGTRLVAHLFQALHGG